MFESACLTLLETALPGTTAAKYFFTLFTHMPLVLLQLEVIHNNYSPAWESNPGPTAAKDECCAHQATHANLIGCQVETAAKTTHLMCLSYGHLADLMGAQTAQPVIHPLGWTEEVCVVASGSSSSW